MSCHNKHESTFTDLQKLTLMKKTFFESQHSEIQLQTANTSDISGKTTTSAIFILKPIVIQFFK